MVSLSRAAFEQLVREGIERIPARFRRFLDDVAVVIEEAPTTAHHRRARLPSGTQLLGLYEGTPRTARAYLPYRLPDKITIFQGPLESLSGGDPDRIREEVAHTVWHELAHALGMSERHVRTVERKRRSRRRERPSGS